MDFVAGGKLITQRNEFRTYFFSMQQNIIARRDLRVNSVLSVDGSRYQAEVVLSVVSLARRKECAIEIIAIVINGPAAAVSAGEGDSFALQLTNVAFTERVLVASDHDARIVQPQHHDMVIAEVVVLVDPVLESEVREDVIRLADEHGLADGVFVVVGALTRRNHWRRSRARREAAGVRSAHDPEQSFGLLQHCCCHHHFYAVSNTHRLEFTLAIEYHNLQ